jgi:hypothetical protein
MNLDFFCHSEPVEESLRSFDFVSLRFRRRTDTRDDTLIVIPTEVEESQFRSLDYARDDRDPSTPLRITYSTNLPVPGY